MSHNPNLWWPRGKTLNEDFEEVEVPGSAWLQEFEGKTIPVSGAGNMVFRSDLGPSGMWVPVSASNRLPVEATLTGTTVSIGGTEFRLLPDGNTLVGKAAQRPSASAAASAIGDGVAYFASDTRVLSTSDGSSWGGLL